MPKSSISKSSYIVTVISHIALDPSMDLERNKKIERRKMQ